MAETSSRPLQLFSREKLDKFRDMSAKARLVWLDEALGLTQKSLGLDRLAKIDSRFQLPQETEPAAHLKNSR